MYTKSIIQQQAELINAKNQFKDDLNNLMNKYIIEDSIFIYDGKSIQEVNKGYFEVLDKYDTLDEAISHCNINDSGIRVILNEDKSQSFEIGKVNRTLNECDNSHSIYDIDCLKMI